jgi:glutamate-5-semialdehyde dehydrogenase
MLDRLMLDEERIEGMVSGLKSVATGTILLEVVLEVVTSQRAFTFAVCARRTGRDWRDSESRAQCDSRRGALCLKAG